MWLYRRYYCRGVRGFFRFSISYDSLSNFYLTNFQLMQHHNYSLYDLENMIPFERKIYVDLIQQHIKEEKERIEAQKL